MRTHRQVLHAQLLPASARRCSQTCTSPSTPSTSTSVSTWMPSRRAVGPTTRGLSLLGRIRNPVNEALNTVHVTPSIVEVVQNVVHDQVPGRRRDQAWRLKAHDSDLTGRGVLTAEASHSARPPEACGSDSIGTTPTGGAPFATCGCSTQAAGTLPMAASRRRGASLSTSLSMWAAVISWRPSRRGTSHSAQPPKPAVVNLAGMRPAGEAPVTARSLWALAAATWPSTARPARHQSQSLVDTCVCDSG